MSLDHEFAVSTAPNHHGVGSAHNFSPETTSLRRLAALAPTRAELAFDLHGSNLAESEIRSTQVRNAKNGPSIVFAQLGDGANPTPRSRKNVSFCSAIGLDFDEGTLDEAGIRAKLDALGIAYWAYSSFRHHSSPDPSKPWQKRKWRVVIPFARAATVAEHAATFEYFTTLFASHVPDQACKDPCRLFYLPRVPANGAHHFQSWVQDGVLFEPVAPIEVKKPGRPANPKTFDAVDPEIVEALAVLPAEDYVQWVKFGIALKRSYGEEGFATWAQWSAKDPRYDEAACRTKWDSFDVSGNGVGAGTIFHDAKQAGWVSRRDREVAELNKTMFVGSWGRKTARLRAARGRLPAGG